MKKIIEIDDSLFEKLEKIQKEYNINSLTPVISLVLTLGVNWFRKLEAIVPHVYTPPEPYWEWTPCFYPTTGTAVDDNIEVKWNVINAISGCINDER